MRRTEMRSPEEIRADLRKALGEELKEIAFAAVSVSELCRKSKMNRMYFYQNYTDKEALADDLIRSKLLEAEDLFRSLKQEKNPQGDPELNVRILPETIYRFRESDSEFCRYTSASVNPYLAGKEADALREGVLKFLSDDTQGLTAAYGTEYTADMICACLTSGIIRSESAGEERVKARRVVTQQYVDLMTKYLFPGCVKAENVR